MISETTNWKVDCDSAAFEECRSDERFPYIVALCRCVNSLSFVHGATLAGDSPKALRSRYNSFFFASALLYEGLKLIEKMHQAFQEDETFQNGLRMVSKGRTAKEIETRHLNPARNYVIFHFDSDKFSMVIKEKGDNPCDFARGIGERDIDTYFLFADEQVKNVLLADKMDADAVVADTRDLMRKFVREANDLIKEHLKRWGFTVRGIPVPK